MGREHAGVSLFLVGAAHNNVMAIATYNYNYTVAHVSIRIGSLLLTQPLYNKTVNTILKKKQNPGHDQFPILNKYGTSYQVSL